MVNRYWVLNLAGATLTEEQMRDIPHPTVELTVHVTYKTVEAFSILGIGVAGPLTAFFRGNKNYKDTMLKFGRRGALLGLVMGPFLTWLKVRSPNCTQESIWDRCYRLRYNRGQVNTDRLTTIGAISGAGAMYFTGGHPVSGAVAGLSMGCLLAGVYNSCLGSKK